MHSGTDHPDREEIPDWPPGPLVDLDQPWADERGSIQPLVDGPMLSASLITSRKGAVRGNHFHLTDWHYCYVLEGCVEYLYRPRGSTAPPDRILASKGTMFFSPPLTEHAMRFPEDSTFLVLSRNPRDQESYEADVVRVQLVEP